MARIRTIKPEFWDSPGTARASLRARLFFIAMWNWADDYGVGSANHRQLLGFAFPNDEDISVKDLPSLCKEVADSYGIVFFDYKERPYYVIPSWNEHQRTERRARRGEALHETAERAVLAHKHAEVEGVTEVRGSSDTTQGGSAAGTGEREQGKGNRGTGEPGNLLSGAEAPDPEEDLGSLIPDGWTPTQRHYDLASSLHVDINREVARFKNHAVQKRRRLKNWNTGFTNWINKGVVMRQQQAGAPAPQRPNRVQENLDLVRQMANEQQGMVEQ